jgi:hypothetical protein
LPEAADAINRTLPQGMGRNVRMSVGMTSFTYEANGRTMAGRYIVRTILIAGPMGGGKWRVDWLGGGVAPQEQTPLAEAVFNRMVQRVQANPQWVAMQNQIVAQATQMVHQQGMLSAQFAQQQRQTIMNHHNAMMNMSRASYERNSHISAENHRHFTNALMGTTDVIDPSTGQTWNVNTGTSNHFWHNGNTVVGTNTYQTPGINYTPLREY